MAASGTTAGYSRHPKPRSSSRPSIATAATPPPPRRSSVDPLRETVKRVSYFGSPAMARDVTQRLFPSAEQRAAQQLRLRGIEIDMYPLESHAPVTTHAAAAAAARSTAAVVEVAAATGGGGVDAKQGGDLHRGAGRPRSRSVDEIREHVDKMLQQGSERRRSVVSKHEQEMYGRVGLVMGRRTPSPSVPDLVRRVYDKPMMKIKERQAAKQRADELFLQSKLRQKQPDVAEGMLRGSGRLVKDAAEVAKVGTKHRLASSSTGEDALDASRGPHAETDFVKFEQRLLQLRAREQQWRSCAAIRRRDMNFLVGSEVDAFHDAAKGGSGGGGHPPQSPRPHTAAVAPPSEQRLRQLSTPRTPLGHHLGHANIAASSGEPHAADGKQPASASLPPGGVQHERGFQTRVRNSKWDR